MLSFRCTFFALHRSKKHYENKTSSSSQLNEFARLSSTWYSQALEGLNFSHLIVTCISSKSSFLARLPPFVVLWIRFRLKGHRGFFLLLLAINLSFFQDTPLSRFFHLRVEIDRSGYSLGPAYASPTPF